MKKTLCLTKLSIRDHSLGKLFPWKGAENITLFSVSVKNFILLIFLINPISTLPDSFKAISDHSEYFYFQATRFLDLAKI